MNPGQAPPQAFSQGNPLSDLVEFVQVPQAYW